MQKPRIYVSILLTLSFSLQASCNQRQIILKEVKKIDRQRILRQANLYLKEAPITVTASACERSAGSIHDYYSEGDYWWRTRKIQMPLISEKTAFQIRMYSQIIANT
jgi:hypothetical protein